MLAASLGFRGLLAGAGLGQLWVQSINLVVFSAAASDFIVPDGLAPSVVTN
jgi:hypothetical protein